MPIFHPFNDTTKHTNWIAELVCTLLSLTTLQICDQILQPNRTSGKIKLTPPVYSYTIILLVLTLSTTQTTRGWF